MKPETRRDHLRVLATAALAWPLAVEAQQGAAKPRIGFLAGGSPQPRLPLAVEALLEGLRELGYVEGRSIRIEYRWAEGKFERLGELAAELVRARVDLIVAAGDASIRAARAASSEIPIVMANSGDAVAAGFVASLARPGGNVTGMTAINPELGAKRLQVLKEVLPRAERIAMLWNPGDATHALELDAALHAAPALGLTLQPIEFRRGDAIDEVFARALRARAEALVMFNDSTLFESRARIVALAASHRLPAMYEASEWADAGGLMAYGVTHADLFRRSAIFVDRILKGARPAELPVEQPTRLRLVLNLRTAKALGLTLPQTLRLQADRVIE
ncbi:MAG: ABC transporter substrate-binding protein [Caldimonas sp.]